MSNIFATDNDVEVQEVSDFSGKRTVDTGVYDATIKVFYLSTAQTGSTMLNQVFKVGNQEITLKAEYLYKDPKVQYYIDKKTGKKKQNIGIQKLNETCLAATGDKLENTEMKEKTIKIWDYDLKKEAPVKRMVITGLTGATVQLAILEIQENKYSDPTQAVLRNEVVKVALDDGSTVAEVNAKKDPVWMATWEERNAGKMRDDFVAPEGEEIEDDIADDDDFLNLDD